LSWCRQRRNSKHPKKYLFCILGLLSIIFSCCFSFYVSWNAIHNVWGCHFGAKSKFQILLIWECAAVFCNDLDQGGILSTYKTFILHVGGAKYHFCSSFNFCWNTIHNIWGCYLVFKASLRFCQFKNLYRYFVMIYTNMAFQALHETFFLHVGFSNIIVACCFSFCCS